MPDPALEDVQALFDTLRRACSNQAWSRGVELARAEVVSADAIGPDEVRVRVAAPGVAIAPTVSLYPGDEDWECECPSRAEACEHAAAGVIALRRSLKEGKPLGAAEAAQGRIRYVLRAGRHAVELERWVVVGGAVHERLRTSLEAIARGRVEGPRVAATSADMEVEIALGSGRDRPLEPGVLKTVFAALERCEDVRVAVEGEAAEKGAGRKVRISREPVTPIAWLDDVPDGLRLRIRPDPKLTRRFGRDLALCGDVLRPIGKSQLDGRELDELTRGRIYRFEEAAQLASQVLPSLRGRIPIEIHTEFLPSTTSGVRPRIEVEVDALPAEGGVRVMATLVYGEPATARVDAGRLVPISGPLPERDTSAERQAAQQAERELGLRVGHRLDLHGEEALAMAGKLRRWRGGVRGEAHERLRREAPLVARFQTREHGFALSFAPGDGAQESQAGASADTAGASAETVIAAWQRGDGFVSLEGGGLAPLPADWLERYGPRIADLLAARDGNERVVPAALPDLARLCDELDVPRPAALGALVGLVDRLGESGGLPTADLAAPLAERLRPYQREGVDWLSLLRDAGLGALLADDMGLGKTLQALCSVRGRSLVVAPTSVLHGWEREAARFRPELRVSTYHGAGREIDPRADLTLTSYAVMRLDIDELARIDWELVVLDEAQAIKNPDSQVAGAAYRLQAKSRLALTGTPVENRLEELWSQLHFLNRGLFGTRSDFRERYARPIAAGDGDVAAHLRERIGPFVLRRMKRDVASDLPPRSDVVLTVELTPGERELYDAIAATTRSEVVKTLAGGGSMIAALEALLRMRQAACHRALVPGQRAEASQSSSKLELLVERLAEAHADGHASLVFSQWTGLLDLIEPVLAKEGLDFVRLDGSTRDRAGVIDRFQAGEAPVMLVSLKAGGTGLNLTAADHIFLLDPWWNPAVEEQAAARAHRIGQTRPVIVHRLIAENTVEERILALHEHKRGLSDMALSDAGAGLTREDLLALLD